MTREIPCDDGAVTDLRLSLSVQDETDEAILPIFLQESGELCRDIGDVLRDGTNYPDDEQARLRRLLHTLKGSADMAGVPDIGERVHDMESMLSHGAADAGVLHAAWAEVVGALGQLSAAQCGEISAAKPCAARSRMVPFASISARLQRVVRQTAKTLDKPARLELIGSAVELDRILLKKMTAPLEHLLRNAVAHGLENETARADASKEPTGEICLRLHRGRGEMVFELRDDGAGLNYAGLREKAEQRHLLEGGAAVSDAQLAQLIFVPGLSTAHGLGRVAGRGIGMDVVRSEIVALGGRIEVTSQTGKGTRFSIHLPLESDTKLAPPESGMTPALHGPA
ncbi:MAG: ATP-binding protein [Gallionella sp.]|nr:ATP-binding protein [Gallionella sp.]